METSTLTPGPLCTAPPPAASRSLSLRGMGFAVLIGLFLLYGFEVSLGLDFRDGDDLLRHGLALGWVAHPYFTIGDGYWLTLPAIVRGAALGLPGPWVLPHPGLVLLIIRLVTLAYLWGCWRLLARCITLLGGGWLAILLFTSFYLFNGGTLNFAASALSEPDCFFYFLVALTLTLRCIAEDVYSSGRLWAIGLALGLACLTRYEAWTFPPVFGGVLLYAARRHGWRPWRRWAGLFIPILPVGAWLLCQAIYQGAPLHFIQTGLASPRLARNFLMRYDATSLETLLTYLAIHPVWVPVSLIAGLAEMRHRRSEPLMESFTVFFALFLLWSVFRLGAHHQGVRFVWDSTLIMAVPSALALERMMRSRPLLGRRLLVVFTLANLVAFIWMSILLVPFVSPALRAFAVKVRNKTAGEHILICDHHLDLPDVDLQLFRTLIEMDHLVLSDWLDHGRPLRTEDLRRDKIAYVLNRSYNGAITTGMPLLVEPLSGWMLWRSRLNQSAGAAATANSSSH